MFAVLEEEQLPVNWLLPLDLAGAAILDNVVVSFCDACRSEGLGMLIVLGSTRSFVCTGKSAYLSRITNYRRF